MQDFKDNRLQIAILNQINLVKSAQAILLAIFLYSGLTNPVSAANFLPAENSEIPQELTLIYQKLDQSKEDQLEVLGPAKPSTISQTLLTICQDRGYGEDCAKSLVGMAWKESNFLATAVGDGGKAQGFFQIHYKLHNISISCAQNLECSANWTIDYLEQNGYPKYETWAIQCHNGCGIDNGYVYSAQRHGRRIWSDDMGTQTLAVR